MNLDVAVDADGTVHVPAYDIPLSIYMSAEAKRAFIEQCLRSPCLESSDDIVRARERLDRLFLEPQLKRARAAFAVGIEEKTIGGIKVYEVTPEAGVSSGNRSRVLINLHGGGFAFGSGALQLIESIPIAATAKLKVLSPDYRLAPEHQFPAASADVTAVYRALLEDYEPENIGIYGSSAGGTLTAMAMAWLQNEKLPPPGAIAILSPGMPISGGDSRYYAAPLNPLFGGQAPAPPVVPNPPPMPLAKDYLAQANLKDPLVSPSLHPQLLARFPPTLLITGTRDVLASPTIELHRQLVRAEVTAQLHAWDGLWHAFYEDVDLPESREVYDVMTRFFDSHLGQP